jgi:hypothetical protein
MRRSEKPRHIVSCLELDTGWYAVYQFKEEVFMRAVTAIALVRDELDTDPHTHRLVGMVQDNSHLIPAEQLAVAGVRFCGYAETGAHLEAVVYSAERDAIGAQPSRWFG